MAQTIGIIAPSSQIPQIELGLGVRALEKAGFHVKVHPQVRQSHWFFAGKDSARAQSFLEYAFDPDVQIVWPARGGYGAMRILSLLDRWTKKYGKPPKKTLVGYSDCTALMEFVRSQWGWRTIHAPMPALRRFSALKSVEWKTLLAILRGESAGANFKLKWISSPPRKPIHGPIVGGNLAVWHAMVGTPYLRVPRGAILFFEDIDESLARLDRMITSLILQGTFKNVGAVVLGDFLNCGDRPPTVLGTPVTARNREQLIHSPKPADFKPLRPAVNLSRVSREIFLQITEETGVPVAMGLPVGHGPGFMPLPMGEPVKVGRTFMSPAKK